MSWRRGKSSGWAAFSNKQRHKHDLEPELDNEPFTPMPTPLTSLHRCKNILQNNDLEFPERSFSSVVAPLAAENQDCNELLHATASSGQQKNKVLEENCYVQDSKKLEDLHCWADESLIKDIMEAVENDVVKASALLTEMVSTQGETNIAEVKTTSPHLSCAKNLPRPDTHGPSEEAADFSKLGCAMEDCPNFNKKMAVDEYASCDKMPSDGNSLMKFKSKQLDSIPVEPEWEEDDIYLSHRKDAIRMTRAASQLSKAATNAFMGGNHVSAQELSLKAQEKWMEAERLHVKAAKEILSIRNVKYDLWRMDLHGLHAAEAVEAVQERLQKIEFRLSLNRSLSPNRLKKSTAIARPSSMESLSFMDKVKLDEPDFPRQRQTSLQIITGIGAHSRGKAALPMAIRSFLDAHSYRYDEVRPGVISVRPKFRHR